MLFFRETEKLCCRTLYFSLIIVKSLQLRGRKQIAEPRKYCLVCVIIFFYMSFFYFISHKFGNFVVIPYTTFTQAIVEDILRIKVGTLNTRDKLTWKENKPWEFMMKIAYQVAHRLSHPPSEEHSFAAQDQSLSKRLWSLNVPSKVQTFMWRACCNVLPTKSKIQPCPVECADRL